LPLGRKAIDAKLIFKVKHLPDGAIERYKVCLVAKGYYQIPGVNFEETFTPVVKLMSICILCALAVRLRLHFHHLDVEMAFLNGDLDVELFLWFPKGCEEKSGQVIRLRRSIYRLKQASNIWNDLGDKELGTISYKRLNADFCLYIYRKGAITCFLAVYIDDMAILGNNLEVMRKHKELLGRQFMVKDLGPVTQLLGISVTYNMST
jgi:Reverse transcriptase (RNA-dependent DNA polymerase)